LESREDIKNYILSVEEKFPVDSWKVNNIHIWPLLRIRLFFYLINQVEGDNTIIDSVPIKVKSNTYVFFIKYFFYKKYNEFKKAIASIKFKRKYYNWLNALPSRENIFIGHDSFRVNYKGKRFNRFFDVLIANEKLNYLFIDHDKLPIDDKFKSFNFCDYRNELITYKSLMTVKSIEFDDVSYNEFLNHLKLNKATKGFVNSIQTSHLIGLLQQDFLPTVTFFKDVFLKVKPQKVHVLCYYNQTVMAMVVAANQLGIETIEMQHGPQTDIHLAYGNWSKIPVTGYDILPRKYWCWDDYSMDVLSKWVNKNELYAIKVIGNPWVDYWKGKQGGYLYKDYVLYSLQPNPLTLDQLFPNEIINLIKKRQNVWFIRLHPRQMHLFEEIKKFLKSKGVLSIVNVDNATNDALPQLLANMKIHVTHCSGTTIEASLFGKKSIIFNKIGVNSFKGLIANKKVVYLNPNEVDFEEKFKKYISCLS